MQPGLAGHLIFGPVASAALICRVGVDITQLLEKKRQGGQIRLHLGQGAGRNRGHGDQRIPSDWIFTDPMACFLMECRRDP